MKADDGVGQRGWTRWRPWKLWMERHRWRGWGWGLAGLLLPACATSAPPLGPLPAEVPAHVVHRAGDITVHLLNTGWVRVKESHRSLPGAGDARMLRIVVDRAWTEAMPVYVGVVQHPEGVFLVDAGLSEATLEPDHFDCDPGTAWVYAHLLDFHFEPAQRVDRQLEALGVRPRDIRAVVFTHRHADHTDALDHLPATAVPWVGARDWPNHQGALPCRWPQDRQPRLVTPDEGTPVGAFAHSVPLTADGRVRVVQMHGHSPGHLGVWVDGGDGPPVVFAGDATFSVEDLRAQTQAGIVEDLGAARATLEALARQVGSQPTFLVPAHDPASARRLASGTVTPR
jgi:N-acyl homoserine lactone hydrolase